MTTPPCIIENNNDPPGTPVKGFKAEKRQSLYERLGDTLVATQDIEEGQVIDRIKLHKVINPVNNLPFVFDTLEKIQQYNHEGEDDYLVHQPVGSAGNAGFVLYDAARNQAGTFFNEIPFLDAEEKRKLEREGNCNLDYSHLKNAELQDSHLTAKGRFSDIVALRDIKANEEIYGCYRMGQVRGYTSGCEGLSVSDAFQLSEGLSEMRKDGEEVNGGTPQKSTALTTTFSIRLNSM